MVLWLIHAQILHEPTVLLGYQAYGFGYVPGPLEAAGLQLLVQQRKAVALPVQSLDPLSFRLPQNRNSVLMNASTVGRWIVSGEC